MIYAYVLAAVTAQGLDILSWGLMPHALVRESNMIVLAMGPKLALDAKITAAALVASLIMDFWWWKPRFSRLLATACVVAGSIGALSNIPH